jgi:BirA family biotin operon repressor/biotin-[acetyl-CoA-carboxylase] ligase
VSAKIKVNQLQEGLRTKRFGKSILFSREIDSTNKRAKELAMYGAPEGTVVIAETQKEGRGRLGREWLSPTGGLYFSVILRPKLRPKATSKLTFVAGLAVAKVLDEMFDLKVETKWPNDVLVNRRKICGIISEMNTTDETVNFVVVGVGVNVNFDVTKVFPKQLRKTATSLENEIGQKIQLEELFKMLLEQVENIYGIFLKEGFDSILEKWKSYASFLARRVEVTTLTEKMNGVASDIDHEGALVLKMEDGTIRQVLAGDVSLQPEQNSDKLERA